MPRINLLPQKTSRRHDAAHRQLMLFAAALGLVLLALGGWYGSMQRRLSAVEARLQRETADLGALEKDVAAVEAFKKKAQTLEHKLAAIENLKQLKVGPAHMLSDLADILTRQPRVWLTGLEEKDGNLTLQGGATDQGHISAFQMALEHDSTYFRAVTLTLVNAVTEPVGAYFQWAISCHTRYSE